jgi:Beta-lactamase
LFLALRGDPGLASQSRAAAVRALLRRFGGKRQDPRQGASGVVLQLAEEGQLSLEDRISTWLPDYPHVSGAITLRQLLSHTSGLFMFWDNQRI